MAENDTRNRETAEFAAPNVPKAAAAPAETAAFSYAPTVVSPRSLEEIPGYVLLGRLGGGGMGVVYKAKQLQLDRIVALKVIRSGDQASARELARFRIEAQAAARLQHPNIVQVYEVGEAHGQPFLCMEYVDGQSLADLIDGTPWLAAPAAGLVETLARAVEVAHQQGIIHRDLKPANVLVGGDVSGGVMSGGSTSSVELTPLTTHQLTTHQIKITDFGVAKLLQSDHGQTETGAFLGSPSYAAPEQAGAHNSAIGPHTDVYALGAILYELLTGRPPFKATNVMETIRQVIDQEPVPPRLLNLSVPPDLEAISLKCLEKNPARRYGTAAGLAEDLRRWQHHEPVQARRPGSFGRAARWCRRHPALATIAAVIVLAVLGMSWLWREAVAASQLAEDRRKAAERASDLADNRRQMAEMAELDADQSRRDAQEEAAAAREIADFLGGLLEEADPFVLTGRAFGEQPLTNPTALDIVNRGAARLANPEMFKTKPLVRASLLDKVGHVYLSLGEGAKAVPFIIEALELRKKHLPPVHADLAASLHNAGFLHLTQENFNTSSDLFAGALDARVQLFGPRSPQAMTSRFHLAFAQMMLNDVSAEKPLLEVLEFHRAQLKAAQAQDPNAVDQEATECAFTIVTLCNFYAKQGQHLRALSYLQEAQQAVRHVANKELAALASGFIRFRQHQALGKIDEAASELRKALAAIETLGRKHHYVYVILQGELGALYFNAGRYSEAEKTYLELEANHNQTHGGGGQGLAGVYYNAARSIARGALARAELDNDLEERRQQVARVEKYARAAYQQGKQHGVEITQMGIYAVFLAHTLLNSRPEPDNAGAEEFARDAVRIRSHVHGAGHELTSHPRCFLLLALARQNKVDDIEKNIVDLLTSNQQPKWDPNLSAVLPVIARQLTLAGKTSTALLVLEQAARAGPYTVEQICADPAFASLRETEDYRRLLKKLAE